MTVPTPAADYTLVQYTDITEAAAFVAALTRYLSSPRGSKYLLPASTAEVWSYVVGEVEAIERIEIYLNVVAVKAVETAFGHLPLSETRRGSQLPADCVQLIGGGGVEAWGVEEAQWHILAER
ncbi:MAG: hypothetical protein LCI00_11050 [Chloroflexi bacterium]|nr:hypothetical protein [Chloroflexota bacterium]MCC6891893.1 hypothetical protein [Anaerolineae bacterium]